MRIVHVSDCYLPRLGGIEVQVHSLAQRQLAAGHDVEVITATPPARHDRTSFEVVDGVPVHRVTVDLPFELPVHPRVGREVTALIARARAGGAGYDVAHLHTGVVSPFAYGAVPAVLAARLPAVLTVHSMWGPARHLFRAAGRVTGWTRWPVVFSAVSSVAAQPIRELVGPAADVRVIPNGIDPAQWLADPLPRADGEVEFVAVMRLAPRKRCLPMLRMVEQVRRRAAPTVAVRLTVVGDGPQRALMQRHIARRGLQDWVELVGRWDRPAIRELYRRADVFVSASDLESFGIAALEARTAGLPVVAKACTGVGEFVRDGVEGVLAQTDADLVDALTELAVSPQRRARIRAHNRAVPPSTTWDDVLARCDAAYGVAAALVV